VAAIVDTSALWQTIVAALAAGVGITLVFSIAILGIVRVVELGRDGRTAAATAFGTLAVIALAVCLGAVVLGVIVMTQK
jgi:hypothetical protein